MNASSELKTHDVFNLVVLTLLVVIDLVYLVFATDFSQLGTDSIGENHRDISDVLLIGFTLYLVIDLLWVIYIPTCVASSPASIITHHIACLVLIYVPWTLRHFSWHLAVNLLVEINTLFLTARRNVSSKSFMFKLFDGLFYLTWVVFRLVLFPILVVFLYYEYERYSISVQTYLNILILAPTLECFVTAMSFKWTYDMLVKILFKGQKKKTS